VFPPSTLLTSSPEELKALAFCGDGHNLRANESRKLRRMLAARNVALRVNGVPVTTARLRRGEKGSELVIADPRLGEFAVDESFSLKLLELVVPSEIRSRLPNGGWRKVSLRILIALLRCGAVRIREES
jgi:hypothetical protein